MVRQQNTSGRAAWFWYVFFAVIIALVLLYVRFPEKEVRLFLAEKVEQFDPDFVLEAGRIKPWPLLGLKITPCSLVARENPEQRVIDFDSLILSKRLLTMFKSEKVYDFGGSLYSGKASGFVQIDEENAGPFKADLYLNEVDLNKYKYISLLLGRQLEGILSGALDVKGSREGLIDASGQANFVIGDALIKLREPVFGVETVEMQNVTIDADLGNRRINTSVEVLSNDFKGSLSGLIRLHTNIERSRLDLKGTIEPYAAFYQSNPKARDAFELLSSRMRNGRLSFAIYGTLKEPRFRLSAYN